MTNTVKRYEVVEDHLNGGTLEYLCPEGRWVKFEDHSAALEQAQKKIAELEAQTITRTIDLFPTTAKDVRDFIGSQFIELRYGKEGGEPHDNDVYKLSAHDILSAFEWSAMAQQDHIVDADKMVSELSSNTLQLPAQQTDRMTEFKASELRKQGYKDIGVVLQNEYGNVGICANSAVRWLHTERDFFEFMHPSAQTPIQQDHTEDNLGKVSAQPIEPAQEPVAWISVEDRLPEVKAEGMGFFLVTAINLQTQKRLVFEAAFLNEMELYSDDHGPEPFSGWHSAKESKDYDGWYEPIGNECCKVTHWMPLPPPPATGFSHTQG